MKIFCLWFFLLGLVIHFAADVRAAEAKLIANEVAPGSAVLLSEFLNEHAPYPECHASTLAEHPSALAHSACVPHLGDYLKRHRPQRE